MDATVWIMVIAIYASAVAAPLAVLAVARRSGHGAAWQGIAIVCAVVIWLILGLGFLQAFLNIPFFSGFLESFGFLGVAAFGILSVMGLVLALKRWPHEIDDSRSEARFIGRRRYAADIE